MWIIFIVFWEPGLDRYAYFETQGSQYETLEECLFIAGEVINDPRNNPDTDLECLYRELGQ